MSDWISTRMCERAARLHRGEHARFAARVEAELDFRRRVADLKERITRKRALAGPADQGVRAA
ncbi:MAG: hypothetical protein LAQ30_26960 [Acidobacteriia bacterium]|nr:hypothetical protein [Terriglobia bacterium]